LILCLPGAHFIINIKWDINICNFFPKVYLLSISKQIGNLIASEIDNSYANLHLKIYNIFCPLKLDISETKKEYTKKV
jgi:hypothetical protein